MSKNERNRRLQQNESILSLVSNDKTASNNSQSTTVETGNANEAVKSNVFDRLKKHWLTIGFIALLSFGALGGGLKYLEESANKERAIRAKENNFTRTEPSLMSKLNPFTTLPSPTPTPQLSKEYIYAGSRMLAVEDANANAAPPADLAVWRKSTGYWYVLGGTGSAQTSFQWGASGDTPVPGDFDGDGKTDFAVFRPYSVNQNATWYVSYSSNGNTFQLTFGLDTDLPAAADFDGDGKTDVAVFRPSTGHWYIQGTTAGFTDIYFGTSGDVPAPADFDGDGKADAALWRAGSFTFYAKRSSDNQTQSQYFNTLAGDEAANADYDGDGKADFAIRQGSNWLIRYSNLTYPNATDSTPVAFEPGTDAVQNDYDGDGKVDIAVWNASNGVWKILQSSNGQTRTEQWGGTINTVADIPVPALYRR